MAVQSKAAPKSKSVVTKATMKNARAARSRPAVQHFSCLGMDRIPTNEDMWQCIIEDPTVLDEVKALWDAHGHVRDLTFVDVFAGWAGLATEFVAQGFPAKAFDRQKVIQHDFTSAKGLAVAIFLALRVNITALNSHGVQSHHI